jgi:integrase
VVLSLERRPRRMEVDHGKNVQHRHHGRPLRAAGEGEGGRERERRDPRFHDLRHTCSTLLLTKGVHPKIAQEISGYSSIAISLDTCSHVILGLGDPAAEAMEDALRN